jgi:hypothetical protein
VSTPEKREAATLAALRITPLHVSGVEKADKESGKGFAKLTLQVLEERGLVARRGSFWELTEAGRREAGL